MTKINICAMRYFNTFYVAIVILFIVGGTQIQMTAQKSIKGVILRYDKPEKNVKITIEGSKFTKEVISNELGEFAIEVPEGYNILEFQESGDKHKAHFKLNQNDTSTFITVNLDKLLGIYSWRIESSLAASSSFFSAYQSSGNNNNITTILGKAIIHLDWQKKAYSWITDVNLLYGESFTKLRLENADGIKSVTANSKSGDLFSVTSKFAQQISNNFHVTLLTNFQSQFAPGYSDPYALAKGQPLNKISNFLSPGTFNLGGGIDYRPNKYLNIYYSPCDLEILEVLIPSLRDRFDVFDGSAAFEFGSFFSLNYRKEILKNVNFNSKLQMFTNYIKNKKHPEAERPGSVDIQLWQNSLNFNFNKHFALSISTTIIYDEDRKFRIFEGDSKLGTNTGRSGPRVQYFHNIGLSVNYSFNSKKN
ncbi:MAG: DUF3078 domain-containing protein [Saprospiraceae bacterium]|nr:DUF3078 domain-containing protein [Saprospiraceae bacterium]MBL0024336.1 DUF3078 domain-containing protein [Saprospiraceae bacterium]